MSDEIKKEEGGLGDMLGGLKDKLMHGLGLDAVQDKADAMIDQVKDKADDILGEKGAAMVDNVVNQAEDKIKGATGIDVDLNKDSK